MNLNRPLSIVSLRSVKPWPMQASNLSKGHFNMNKISRFNAAVQGDPVDRPPVTSWVHFQPDHMTAHEVAQMHLRFRSEEHTSELQSRGHLISRLLPYINTNQ